MFVAAEQFHEGSQVHILVVRDNSAFNLTLLMGGVI